MKPNAQLLWELVIFGWSSGVHKFWPKPSFMLELYIASSYFVRCLIKKIRFQIMDSWFKKSTSITLTRRMSAISSATFFVLMKLFVPNGPFLYSLKISESFTIFWCFQGVEKGCIGNKRVHTTARRYWVLV